jgi:Ca2+-binding EF-hand superfamily protein
MYDIDKSGKLDAKEVSLIFEQLCLTGIDAAGKLELTEIFRETLRNVKIPVSGEVDFEGFEVLITQLQEERERIHEERECAVVEQCGLTKEEVKEHKDDLLDLHDSFQRWADPNSKSIDREHLRGMLLEYNLLPHSTARFDQLVSPILSKSSTKGRLVFSDCLKVIRRMREMIRSGQHGQIQEMYERMDKGRSGRLSKSSIFSVIGNVGLSPHSREEQADLKHLIDDADVNQSGDLDVQEFESLVMRVQERRKAVKRRATLKTADELGVCQASVAQLREVFYRLDEKGEEVLAIGQLRTLLDRLHKSVPPDVLRAKVSDFTSGPDCSSAGAGAGKLHQKLDFEGFLRFAKFFDLRL